MRPIHEPTVSVNDLPPTVFVWCAYSHATGIASLEDIVECAGLFLNAMVTLFCREGIFRNCPAKFFTWVKSDPRWTIAWAVLRSDMALPPRAALSA